MDMNILVVDVTTLNIYDFLKKNETEAELLARAEAHRQECIDICTQNLKENLKNKDYWENILKSYQAIEYKVMEWNDFRILEREKLLGGELKEITEEEWCDALNILPPYKWCTIDGIEMFCSSEMLTGKYTSQYAKADGKYYTKVVDCTDKNTWIHNILLNEKRN